MVATLLHYFSSQCTRCNSVLNDAIDEHLFILLMISLRTECDKTDNTQRTEMPIINASSHWTHIFLSRKTYNFHMKVTASKEAAYDMHETSRYRISHKV